ncbi:MAG: hypothetical protein H3C62_13020 [Gemmatimonadaceae bacterium]|nr:hypothetical protein [Gemmatimonadaceae bacterium]
MRSPLNRLGLAALAAAVCLGAGCSAPTPTEKRVVSVGTYTYTTLVGPNEVREFAVAADNTRCVGYTGDHFIVGFRYVCHWR